MFRNFFRKSTSEPLKNISLDLSKVFPIIKGKISTAEIADNKMDMSGTKDPISLELVDNLFIFFAIDKGEHFEYLNQSDLINCNKSIQEIRDLSITNLVRYYNEKGVSIEGDENMLMIKFDHNMESSLLLIDTLWTQLIVKLQDNLVIAVPSREILLITKASNSNSIAQLKEGAIDLYASGRHKLTENLLLRKLEGSLSKYE